MAYLRLFIELQSENTGASHGQARVELQNRPGQVDVKMRGVLTGLWSGDVYEAALVSERKGRYREYPLGQFIVNGRGQANLLFRGSFSDEAEDGLGVAGFKAFVARSGRKRIVGYRGEYISIPDQYEDVTAEVIPEPEAIQESELPEEIVETAAAVEPEIVDTPEESAEVPAEEENAEVEDVEESIPVDSSGVIEEENTCQFDEAISSEEGLETASVETQEEKAEIQNEVAETAAAEEEIAAVNAPVDEVADVEETAAVEPAEELPVEPAAPVSAEAEPPTLIAKSLPEPVYVIRDLGEVSELCGSAGAHAFQRYHHLIFIEQGSEHLLGMPSRYRPSQHEELAEDGYTEFFTPHGGAPSYGEFGYWMKKV